MSSALVAHALEFGVVLSAVLCALLLIVLRANPEIMPNDYPPDIRAKWGPMTSRTKRQRVVVAILLFAVVLAIVAWSIKSLPTLAAGNVTFSMGVLNEKRLIETAGLARAHTLFAQVPMEYVNLVEWVDLVADELGCREREIRTSVD